MIGLSFSLKQNFGKVAKAADKAKFRSLGHAAAAIRKAAAASIETAEGPSAPGTPPHTHKGTFLRRALRYRVDKQRGQAVIGPRASVVGDVGRVLEFGGTRGDTTHRPRPFMFPALQENVARFADRFRGSIGV